MKRITLILTALFCCVSTFAKVVSTQQAQAAASAFFGGGAVTLAGSSVGGGGITKASDSPEIYVFNNPAGGWVIISGEDSLSPVLAYSRSGSFSTEGLPPNLSWWMGNIRSSVTGARLEKRAASGTVREAWAHIGEHTKAAGKSAYMETAAWSQDSPYNFYCPEVTESEGEAGERIYTSLTGCTATAAAIILRYHQYPATGTGTLPDYSYLSDYKVQMDIKGYDISSHRYNYELMPLSDKEVQSAGSSAQQQVAQLMHDIGVAFKSEYNYNTGTGVATCNVLQPLVDNFGFSSSARQADRMSYNPGDWIAALKGEIDAGRPLLYGGYSEAGGHMFVLAGYDESDLFYVNWGWAGNSNGYFTIKDLTISEKVSFSQDQTTFLGLVPEQGGEFEQEISFRGDGITVTSGSLIQGQDFKLNAGSLYNFTYQDYDGAVRLALVDYKDSLKCYAGSEYAIQIPKLETDLAIHSVEIEDYTCNVPQDMNFGDGIAVFYKSNLNNWKTVPYDHESGKVFRYGAYDACAIIVPDSIRAGDVIAPSVLKGWRQISSVGWFLNGIQFTTGQTDALLAGAHILKAVVSFADGSTETIVQEIKVE